MLVNCNSCQKNFNVPDSAITKAGRLLQCGFCGNKWTQYPIEHKNVKDEKPKKEVTKKTPSSIKKPTEIQKIKTSSKKKKREINLYSEEYLKKKHGLIIKDKIDNEKVKTNKRSKTSSNFFRYLIISGILLISLFEILNIKKKFIIINYPSAEPYIDSLYETLEILRFTIFSLLN